MSFGICDIMMHSQYIVNLSDWVQATAKFFYYVIFCMYENVGGLESRIYGVVQKRGLQTHDHDFVNS